MYVYLYVNIYTNKYTHRRIDTCYTEFSPRVSDGKQEIKFRIYFHLNIISPETAIHIYWATSTVGQEGEGAVERVGE